MMLRILFILAVFSTNLNDLYAQISERDFKDLKRFENNLGRTIDTTYFLMKNCQLVFSHSTEFRLVHFIDSFGQIHFIDAGYRNISGYTSFYEDCINYFILEYRGNGSENKPYYLHINKSDGTIKYL